MRDQLHAEVSQEDRFRYSIVSTGLSNSRNVDIIPSGRRRRGLFASCKFDHATGCWNWTGSTNGRGYGQTTFHQKYILVHRLAAILWLKFDPVSGLNVLHSCDNRLCFNPKHLFFGTDLDNIRDMMAKGRENFRGHKGPAKFPNPYLHRRKKIERFLESVNA